MNHPGPSSSGAPVKMFSDDACADLWPAWSPDGARLAYASLPVPPGYEVMSTNTPDGGCRRIWMMNADGTGKKQLTDDAAYADEWPMWSAEGGIFSSCAGRYGAGRRRSGHTTWPPASYPIP